MNQDRIQGNWKQVRGKVKEQWGKLTDDDLDVIDGRREQLLGRIQERHGIARSQAESELNDFEQSHPDVSWSDALVQAEHVGDRNPTFFFEKS
jgi:uncharacterized protein YjbJ (UPF0337 family)